MQAPQRRRRNDAMLTVLLSEVNRARSAFRAGRLASVAATGRPEQALRAARLASAMESYADAAVSTGVPLPYRYRDELRLYQAITRARGDWLTGPTACAPARESAAGWGARS